MDENNKTPHNKVVAGIKTVRTFSSDMAEAVRDNEMSVMKVALAEQKKKENDEVVEKSKGTPLTKALWVGGGIALVVLGIGAYYLVVQIKNPSTVTNTPVITQHVALVPYDQKVDLDITNIVSSTEVMSLVKEQVAKSIKANGLRYITLNRKVENISRPVTSKEFVRAIESTIPTNLSISLADTYMVGTYLPEGENERSHLFLLFETKDYNTAYASLLVWEHTMLDDLFTMFDIDVAGDNKELFGKPWKDQVINNKDARVLYGTEGEPILYYLFLDKNHFIITDSAETIREVTTRMITKNIKPL